MEDEVLIEITIKVAEKLFGFYEIGLITKADLVEHMNLKAAFLNKVIECESNNCKIQSIQSVLQRYKSLRNGIGELEKA